MNAPVRIDLKDVSSFPSRRVEQWKYTDVRRYLRDVPTAAERIDVEIEGGPFRPLCVNEYQTFGNGRTHHGDNLLRGFGRKGLTARPDEPLLDAIRFVSESPDGGWQASMGYTVGPNDHVVLLESYEGRSGAYVANAAINFVILEGGRLDRIVLADDTAESISFSRADVTLGEGSEFNQTILTTGAKLQRFETIVAHPGSAEVRIDGLYLLDGARHADLTTVVRHGGLNGVTSQLTKGVVRDTARGVFQGKIVVERGADGTDARMGHHALILGERAEVDAKPELEIYADDVQCAHGNTVGNLDESALFYMQQRGLPVDEARALLTQAFLIEVVDRIEHEGAREVVREWLTARL